MLNYCSLPDCVNIILLIPRRQFMFVVKGVFRKGHVSSNSGEDSEIVDVVVGLWSPARKLNTFAYLTVNVACNFAHERSE